MEKISYTCEDEKKIELIKSFLDLPEEERIEKLLGFMGIKLFPYQKIMIVKMLKEPNLIPLTKMYCWRQDNFSTKFLENTFLAYFYFLNSFENDKED